MRVIRAETMGMCFGVRDALTDAFARRDAHRVTIHGELVHNAEVNARLRSRGYQTTREASRTAVPDRPTVLITAHGVSDRERDRLQRAGKELIDTTCPLVRRAHQAAVSLSDDGYHVLVIGKPGHVEVDGLTGDLDSWEVVPDARSVRRYPQQRLGVVCQTTTQVAVGEAVVAAVRERNPHAEVRFVDTICEPTRQRVRAIDELASRVDTVVVVGGRNSNNTRQLAERAATAGVRTFHVTGPAELDLAWFTDCATVGLAAGTSTPDDTIDAVQRALESASARARSLRPGA